MRTMRLRGVMLLGRVMVWRYVRPLMGVAGITGTGQDNTGHRTRGDRNREVEVCPGFEQRLG